MKILATPRRASQGALSVEVNEVNLNWIFRAINIEWPSVETRTQVELTELPELTRPGVKYRKCGEGKVIVCSKYRAADGKWKNHRKTVSGVDQRSGEALANVIRSTEELVHAYCLEHHVEGQGEEGDEGEVEDEAESSHARD